MSVFYEDKEEMPEGIKTKTCMFCINSLFTKHTFHLHLFFNATDLMNVHISLKNYIFKSGHVLITSKISFFLI